MQENKKLLIDVAMVLALIGIGAAGYWFSPLLLPVADLTATPAPGCDLNQSACSVHLPDGGRLELSISPRPIPVVQPLKLEVTASGIRIDSAEVDFAGISMNMGYNRPKLAAQGNGRFTGETTLPVCITGPMAWQTTLIVEAGRQRISVPFRFDANSH